jgi:UPF0176 protein
MSKSGHQAEQEKDSQFQVAAFYRFVPLPDCAEIRLRLQEICDSLGLLGTILVASEGINGTISGPEEAVNQLFMTLSLDSRFAGMDHKTSRADEQPFYRMKVRIKKEIVSMGIPGVDPSRQVGEYVSPGDWNALISRDDVRLIDTRNVYEYHLGTFDGAEDPGTDSFRDFPDWADTHLDPAEDKHIAMFCTGGIRCEKATSYLKQQGFENVYHLDGGILNYLEQIEEKDSRWRGDCFVFDNRVTVDHNLEEGNFEVCPACRMPLTEEDRQSPDFELNVSCPKCIHRLTPSRREGLLERARQIELAAKRGDRHIGVRQPDPKSLGLNRQD